MTHRLVVPSTFLPVERAEQTTAILLFSSEALPCNQYPIAPLWWKYSPHNIIRDIHRQLSNTRPSELLDNPCFLSAVIPLFSATLRYWRSDTIGRIAII